MGLTLVDIDLDNARTRYKNIKTQTIVNIILLFFAVSYLRNNFRRNSQLLRDDCNVYKH